MKDYIKKMSKGKEQKPVILQVLPELDHGGVEVGTVQIADALRQHGIKNFVASAGGRMVHDLEKIKVPHITLPLKTKNPIKLYLNSLKLEKIIKENGINIVHARSRAPAWSAYWAAKRAGVKFMTTFHGTYGLGPKGIKKFYNRVMTYGQLVIAISNHIKSISRKIIGSTKTRSALSTAASTLKSFRRRQFPRSASSAPCRKTTFRKICR